MDPLVAAIDAIVAALRARNKHLLFGNGGSAADAQSHRYRVRRLLQNRAGAGDRIHRGAGPRPRQAAGETGVLCWSA